MLENVYLAEDLEMETFGFRTVYIPLDSEC